MIFLLQFAKQSPRFRRNVPVMVATTKTAPEPSHRGANVWSISTSQPAASSSTSVCSSCTCVTVLLVTHTHTQKTQPYDRNVSLHSARNSYHLRQISSGFSFYFIGAMFVFFWIVAYIRVVRGTFSRRCNAHLFTVYCCEHVDELKNSEFF
jgi:hypothetical protein